jgi:dihydrofolate reductase
MGFSLSLIVAVSRNGIIGHKGELPWRISDDLKNFKSITMGKPIIMGRRTFDSIGVALDGRQNIVVSRSEKIINDDVEMASSLDKALKIASKVNPVEVMIIGGGEIYNLALPKADRIYLTEVHIDVKGDVYFPALNSKHWGEVSRKFFSAEDNTPAYSFVVLERNFSKVL